MGTLDSIVCVCVCVLFYYKDLLPPDDAWKQNELVLFNLYTLTM